MECVADREGLPHRNEISRLDGLTPHTGEIDRKGENPALANLPTDLFGLLGPPDPPEKRNAAPVGPRNGAQVANEARQPHHELYDLLSDLLGPVSGPLDRPLSVTQFADATSKRQTRSNVSLRQFAETIRDTRARTKGGLPWLKLARFGEVATTKGALRHDANLTAIDGIEGDYDAGEVTVADACERLSAANLAALVYTTPSHTPSAPRWRVLVPTNATLQPDERDALCERLNGALGGILAPESFTRSQAYYFGAVGAGDDHEVRLVEGRSIDRADDIAGVGRASIAAPADDPDDDDLASMIEPDWARIGEALPFIPADDREIWLNVGMALHAESRGSDAGRAAWDNWARASDKFDSKDQGRTWKSFGERRGKSVGIGTLFHLAGSYGWNAAPPAKPSRLTFLTPSECESTPSRGYVVKGILAPGDVGCIFGAPGAGKSLLSPHIGYAVAQGRDAFGMRSKPGRVLYVAAEDSHGMRGRINALKRRHDDAPDFVLVEGVSDLLSADSQDLAALIDAVEAQRPAIVFVDTLAMAFPGLEENDAKDMGRVVAVARKLTTWGAAVVLIHHDTKAEGSTPRGHSLLNGALDMALHVTRDEVGIVRAKLTKNRNGSCERDMAFTIATETLGHDEDGDAITAALVDELAAGAAPSREKVSPEKAALRILDRMTDSSGLGPEWVAESDWRDVMAADRSVSASESPENRKRSIRRIIEKLAQRKLVEWDGDTVRPARGAGADALGDMS